MEMVYLAKNSAWAILT